MHLMAHEMPYFIFSLLEISVELSVKLVVTLIPVVDTKLVTSKLAGVSVVALPGLILGNFGLTVVMVAELIDEFVEAFVDDVEVDCLISWADIVLELLSVVVVERTVNVMRILVVDSISLVVETNVDVDLLEEVCVKFDVAIVVEECSIEMLVDIWVVRVDFEDQLVGVRLVCIQLEQLYPLQDEGHKQVYPREPMTTHVPPFSHGDGKHGNSCKHRIWFYSNNIEIKKIFLLKIDFSKKACVIWTWYSKAKVVFLLVWQISPVKPGGHKHLNAKSNSSVVWFTHVPPFMHSCLSLEHINSIDKR